jgi:hypothetical protein
MNDRQARPSAALIVATIALAAAFTTTAIAGPGALTRAVSPAKVKKIAGKQIKKKAVLGPGKVITAHETLPANSQEGDVINVPGFVALKLTCQPGQMFWTLRNIGSADLHMSGVATRETGEIEYQDLPQVGAGAQLSFVGGTSAGWSLDATATGPKGSVRVEAEMHPITGTTCPTSAQAVLTK